MKSSLKIVHSINHTKPNYHGGQWQPCGVTVKREAGTETWTMRPSQQKVFDKHRADPFVIINKPTGSGKSKLILFVHGKNLLDDPKSKLIIAVPQTIVGAGFQKQKGKKTGQVQECILQFDDGTEISWDVEHDLCNGVVIQSKTKTITDFMKQTDFVEGLNERVLICTHAALALAYKKIGVSHLANTTIIIDEAHRVLFAQNGDIEVANKLGSMTHDILEHHLTKDGSVKLWFVTATFFRGDKLSILSEEDRKCFTKYYMPFDQHWVENMPELESFGWDYLIYEKDPFKEIKTILKNKQVPTIIYCPPQSHILCPNGKYEFVKQLTAEIRKVWKDARINDLVTEYGRDERKQVIIDDSKAHDADIILTIDLLNEGADWVIAQQVLDLNPPQSSLLRKTQRFGRLTRPYPGKTHIHYYTFLMFSTKHLNEEERRENLNKNFNQLIAALAVEDTISPIPILRDKTKNKTKKTDNGDDSETEYVDWLHHEVNDENHLEKILQDSRDALVALGAINSKPGHEAILKCLRQSLKSNGITKLDECAMHIALMWRRAHPRYRDVVGWDGSAFEKICTNEIFDILTAWGGHFGKDDLRAMRDDFTYYTDPLSVTHPEVAKEWHPTKNVDLTPDNVTSGSEQVVWWRCHLGHESQVKIVNKVKRGTCVGCSGWKNESSLNKTQLLDISEHGSSRPHWKTTLGNCLTQYTRKDSDCYDADFDKQIRKLRPDWFIAPSKKANEKKKILMEIAINKESRPSQKTKIGKVLSQYTGKYSDCYDVEFDKKIRKIRPDWFISQTEQAYNKKELILKVAKNGRQKPCHKTDLGRAIWRYTYEHSATYDADFDKQIRKLRPDWFITPSKKANEKKKILLEMARQGSRKPSRKPGTTGTGNCLKAYTSKNSDCYDAVFDKKIRKLRPDWFRKHAS